MWLFRLTKYLTFQRDIDSEMDDLSHYARFSSLERTIKFALAFYLLVLIVGIAGTVAGWGYLFDTIAGIPDWGMYAGLVVAGGFAGIYGLVSSVHGLGELHIWLDRRMFGFLERSNEIIFQEVVRALEPGVQHQARDLAAEQRYSIVQSVFTRLAGNRPLFEALMESGIFRTWIWYWVMNYGTFTFTILTAAGFAAMLGGSGPVARTFFTICWGGALLHVGANLLLGHHLTRMTKRVSEEIVRSQRPRIVTLMRETLPR